MSRIRGSELLWSFGSDDLLLHPPDCLSPPGSDSFRVKFNVMIQLQLQGFP